MSEAMLSGLVLGDVVAVLTTVYWACLVVGGGLLLISVLGGLGHGDVDVDAHSGLDFHGGTDVGHADADFHAGADVGHAGGSVAETAHSAAHVPAGLSTWFSIRFLVFFAAVFGAVGVVLTYVAQAGVPVTFGVSLVSGLVLGQAVHQTLRAIRRGAGDSAPQPRDYLDQPGRVTVSIHPPDMGEVVVHVRSGERYVPAVAHGASGPLQVGDEVKVVAYKGGVAEVISRANYERLH